jgi:hypothetical protein
MSDINKYIYKGAIHIHTKLSDGTGSTKSVVKAARQSGLDWIIITDHNYYDTEEGIIDGVYVIKGEEVSSLTCNHCLALGINQTIQPDDNQQVYLDKICEQGGFSFAAHPDEGTVADEEGNLCPRKNSYKCIPWTDKNVKPDGIEIWNWFSNWADNIDDSSIFKLAYAYFFKNSIIKPPSPLTLKWWDKLNSESENVVPALGGVDAHALKIYRYILPLTIFPYKTCFDTITNFIYLPHKLSEDFKTAKKQILNAVKSGNNMIINRKVCRDIPQIYITNSQKTYYCGEDVLLDKNCCLHFVSKEKMSVCLVYNGTQTDKFVSDKFDYTISKSGKYRLEVFYKNKGYIYTNPFNVKDKVEA